MNYVASQSQGEKESKKKQEIIKIFQRNVWTGGWWRGKILQTRERKRGCPTSSSASLSLFHQVRTLKSPLSPPDIIYRRSLAKVLGEFSLKEHLFYAGIFFSMSLIVIFCFLLVNRDNSSSSLSSAQLSYYDGGQTGYKIACRGYFAQIVCKLSNDKTISFISIRRICCDCL